MSTLSVLALIVGLVLAQERGLDGEGGPSTPSDEAPPDSGNAESNDQSQPSKQL